jgi:hypothetical protein
MDGVINPGDEGDIDGIQHEIRDHKPVDAVLTG